MAKTRKEDIKQLSNEDLREKIAADQELLTKLRFNHAVSPLDNPLLIRNTRREIARLTTELNMRLNAEGAQTTAG